MGIWYNGSWFSRLSIEKRLPLLICSLLLLAILIFSFATFYALKKATLEIGKERLSTLTKELSTLFGQSAQVILKKSSEVAGENTVLMYLQSGGKKFRGETLKALNDLHRDSTWVSEELIDDKLTTVLRSDKSTVKVNVNLKDVLSFTRISPDAGKVGKIYNVKGLMYYPIISAVTVKKNIIGYILAWVKIQATPKAVAQLSQLVGTDANFYIGDIDGSLWTNMVKIIPKPPFKVNLSGKSTEYTDTNGEKLLINVKAIPNTGWLIAIAFPERIVLTGVNGFVNWLFVIGLTLTAIGMFAAWIMSRNITRPLKELTAAATAISEGNYSLPVAVDVNNTNELGKLADAFNIMKAQVYNMHNELENRVMERTLQLKEANKELEAFSYSVSHDLRTPLRAINGYAIMLKEDYENTLDDEGHRILGHIISNAKMMGQLIDDLLSFSRLGKKALKRTKVEMELLAQTVVNELLVQEPEDKYKVQISSLPAAEGDEVMLKQVLMNLVGNAIKYSSKKTEPEIEIGFKEEETKTIYYVKDNGAGFDMAYAAKLYGVFQRLHSHDEFEGSGVGLALVKRIIEKHKGETWAEGMENVGAVFYFSLPKL